MHVRQYDELTYEANGRFSGKEPLGGGIHPYFELFCLRSGRVLLEWIGTTYTAEAPALFIVSPSIPHRLHRLSAAFDGWYMELELHEDDVRPNLEAVMRWNSLQTEEEQRRRVPAMVGLALASLREAVDRGWHRNFSVHGSQIVSLELRKLLLLVEESVAAKTTVVRQAPAESGGSAREQVYELIRYIEADYAADIRLKRLAEMAGLTPAYIIKLFKAQIGLTPLQYLNQLRLNAAVSYLRTTPLSIRQIAERTGFASLHYFSRVFKITYGVSPTHWRSANTGAAQGYPPG